MNFKVDFVVTWVDGSDPKWIAEKNKYSLSAGSDRKSMNSKKAFREWGTFKYWFRGVQKFAPWVNKVYLVTYNQKPSWININNDKLVMDLLKKVGVPDSGYFIEYDDSDYAQRLQRYSKIVFATEACLHRQLAKKSDVNNVTTPYNWRNYYKIRNNIIFDQRYGKNWKVRRLSPIILIAHHIVLAVRQHHLKKNLPIILRAYFDGIHLKMGKQMNPNY